MVSAEREAVFKNQRLHMRWLRALREVMDLLHLFHPDSLVMEADRKKKQQTALRTQIAAQRAAKRASLKEKYRR